MSLIITAPASTAARATLALYVSMESGIVNRPDKTANNWQDARELVCRGYRQRAGPRGLPADIDDVRTVRFELKRLVNGGVGIERCAARKGVRRDVDDAHDETTFPKKQSADAGQRNGVEAARERCSHRSPVYQSPV